MGSGLRRAIHITAATPGIGNMANRFYILTSTFYIQKIVSQIQPHRPQARILSETRGRQVSIIHIDADAEIITASVCYAKQDLCHVVVDIRCNR